jgi:hypothetical protein
MNFRPGIAWSVGAAGPVLRLVAAADPRDGDWRDFALCTEVDPDRWFPGAGASPWAAMMTCRRCPVRSQCLSAAERSGLEEGVWGGVLFVEGRIAATELRCQRGLHVLDEDNTYTAADGTHYCRPCKNERRQGVAA